MSLLESWKLAAHAAGIDESYADELWRMLEERYESEGRHYHHFGHIEKCLRELRGIREVESMDQRIALEMAIWFHDAVYDVRADDNEVRSAEMAKACLGKDGWPDSQVASVVSMILATRHHGVPETLLECLMVDIDLAILGSEAQVYDQYAEEIRREYAHVSEADYRDGRRRVLGSFLDRAAIYSTEAIRGRYEVRARENLTREILSLS